MLLSGTSFKQSGTDPPDTNAKVKAVFIYNFSKLIEWPESYKRGNFIITILGQANSLKKELDIMAKARKKDNQNFEIKVVESVNKIGHCHMLIIPEKYSHNIGEVKSKIRNRSTLIISDKDGMAKKGAIINFVIVNNKQNFELNMLNANKHNLKVSSYLASLAIMVQ